MTALRTGYTTGSCAAAAAKAATLLLAEGRKVESTEIPLPDGRRVSFPLAAVGWAGECAEAAVRKDAGDDPDVTNGALVHAAVCWTEGDGVQFAAGPGVGVVTKPGLAIPPGEPAINPVPRRMIVAAVREVTPRGVRIAISIPGGEELGRKTFNPRIGVIGGLSILGTTGIVRPFSCSALRASIACALDVVAATGCRTVVFVPGHIGERAAQANFRIVAEAILEVGNEWGFALDEAVKHSFAALLAVGHPGKLAKLGAGDWDTHSSRSGSALPIVAKLHTAALGRPPVAATTVEGIFNALPPGERMRLGDALAGQVQAAIAARTGGRFAVAAVLIDLGGHILGEAGDCSPWR
jgi:cobalt-precorrin-5B (C1)-methyltransferase